MPRKGQLSSNKASKTEMKDSKLKAILADFDGKVKNRLEELDDKVKEYCDEIANECNSMLARIPKNHQNMLILDYVDMKNKEQEAKNNRMDTSDDVFESVATATIKNGTPMCDEPSTSSGSRSPRFLKPSTVKRQAKKKTTAASVENLSSAGRSGSATRNRPARSNSAKERSASESRATSRGRAASTKRAREAAGSALSGAFSAIRSGSQHRTPDTKLSTPLRKCRAGERLVILSESGSPLSNGNEPTIVCPTKDGTMVTMSSRNMDYIDEDTRENLKMIHNKLSVLLDRM